MPLIVDGAGSRPARRRGGPVRTGTAKDLPRVPGLAVYPHAEPSTVPLALRTGVEVHHVLHEHVVILTLEHKQVPHVHREDRVHVNVLGDGADGLVHLSYEVGFHDSQDVPAALRDAVQLYGRRPAAPGQVTEQDRPYIPELDLDVDSALYVLSILRVEPGSGGAPAADGMPRWQRALFRQLTRASAQRIQVLHLPSSRALVMGAEIEL